MVHHELRVNLFGGLAIQRLSDPDAAPITRFPTRKVATLLALLALSPGRRFTRETLIDSLWTDSSLEDGRRSLRVALTVLRRILEPPGTVYSDVLVADRETVSLRAEAIITDVAEFESAVRRGDVGQARTLYDAGPLLPALYDEWVLDVRTRLDDTYSALPERASPRAAVAVAELPTEPAPSKKDPDERLPFYLTRFIGREAEVENLVALWDDPANRLITVTGTGGMGKTRLVTQASAVTARSRVLRFAALYDATDNAGLQRAMITLLHLDPTQADGSSIVHALDALGSVRLILDNVEQLITVGVTETIEEWLAACPGLQIIATSRQRLNIPGERELPLSVLVAPTLPATPERLLDFDSVRLFVDRAQMARSDVHVTPRNAETIAMLCDQLGGLPLALELTAAWAGVLTFSQMLMRVESYLLDEAGPPTAAKRATRPERHRTLRTALDISFDLLTPDLQNAFIGLAVFRGGFTAEAAQAVLGEAGSIETISSLRDSSLIVVETGTESEMLRFRMLPVIYAYARERFEGDAHRATALSGAHSDYFLLLAEAPRTEEKTLDVDADNFRVALDIAEARRDEDTDLRLCIALAPF